MLVSMPVADIASAFWESTLPGQVIVIILFLGSALAWTIMWTKGVQLRFEFDFDLMAEKTESASPLPKRILRSVVSDPAVFR